MADPPKTYGQKGKIIHSQAREIIARVTEFMRNEAEVYQQTGLPLIPLPNYKQRVLAATGISERTYRVLKDTADLISTHREIAARSEDPGNVPTSYLIIPQFLIIRNDQAQAEIQQFSCSSVIKSDYKCKVCEFATFFMTDLLRHVGNVHFCKVGPTGPGEVEYRCANCDFATFSQLVLLKHVRNKPDHQHYVKFLKNHV